MSYPSARQNHIGSYIVNYVCIHNPENNNNWVHITEEAHYCMVLLLHQGGLVLFNICNLEFQHFKTFNSCDESKGDWHLKYVLDILSFVFDEPCEDGTLVLKRVVVCMCNMKCGLWSVLLVFS
jgi:hypothetical protein